VIAALVETQQNSAEPAVAAARRTASWRSLVFPTLLIIVLFVILPLAAVWFGVDSRERFEASQW
jgi:hypothetical protein